MEQLFITEGQKKSWRRQAERKMKINDVSSMILGLFGMSLAFYEHEIFFGKLNWDKEDEETGRPYTVEEEQYEERPASTALRLIIGLTTVLLVYTIYNHYRILLDLNKAKQKYDSYDSLRSVGLFWPMITEMSYCAIHCPPGCNWVFTFEQLGGDLDYAFDTLVCIVMLGRIYLIWRIFANYSSWNDERAEEICNRCLCDGGVSFAIKAELKERPYFVMSIVMFISIFIFGTALRTAERPFKETSGQDWEYVWNGMWCIVITMTTVGFGDFYPSTHLGRLIGVLACFWGTFLVSLMVVSLTISSEFTPQERKAYDKIKRHEAEEEIKVKAANAIKFAMRVRKFLKDNPYASEKQKAKYMNSFKNAIIEYRSHKRNLVASEQDAPIEYILAKLNDKVTFGLDRIKNDCHIYKTLLARLDAAEGNQKRLQNELDKLTTLNMTILQKVGGGQRRGL
jgi:hypothetical protein